MEFLKTYLKNPSYTTIVKSYGLSKEAIRMRFKDAVRRIVGQIEFSRIQDRLFQKLVLENRKLKKIIESRNPKPPNLRVKKDNKLLSLPVSMLNLSLRAENVLKRAGIKIINDLAKLDQRRLYKLEGCGIKTVRQIENLLGRLGLELNMIMPFEKK